MVTDYDGDVLVSHTNTNADTVKLNWWSFSSRTHLVLEPRVRVRTRASLVRGPYSLHPPPMQARITPNSVLEVLRRGAQEVNPLMAVASVTEEKPGAYLPFFGMIMIVSISSSILELVTM